MTFSYDGTNFNGYQKQPRARTVQKVIEDALKEINSGKSVNVCASGRTDAGVHALNQKAHFEMNIKITPDKLLKGLNSLLPEDVYVKKIEEVSDDFHARYSANGKEYIYKINMGEYNPIERNYVYQYNKKLDIIAIGESLIELSTSESLKTAECLNKYYGGDTLTTAITALRLGSKVGFISRIGMDCFKDYLLESWQEEGLDISHVKPVNGINGLYMVSKNKENFLNNNNHFNNNYQQNYNNFTYNQEIINLKNELYNKNQIIEQLKIQINNLQNQLSYLNNINNNNQLSIQNLQNNINIKDQEIFQLKNKLNIKIDKLNKLKLNNNNINNMIDRSKTLAINFMSVNHDKIFPIFCLNSDSIVKCEEIFYNEYPEYKENDTYLTANGKKIKRFKTLEENGIKQGTAIIVNTFDE